MYSILLPKESRERFTELPETGMGFQEVKRIPEWMGVRGFVLNTELLWILERMDELEPEFGESLARIQPLFRNLEAFLAHTEQREREPFDAILRDLSVLSGAPPAPLAPPVPGASGLPPFLTFSRAGEEFFRLSAWRSDRKILPDGSVASGTFATTPSDLTVTPSGLAAVGRFALPNRLPACYIYQIIPDPGTPMYFGTVVPNYGMAGGGVEVVFPYGCGPGSARLWKTLPIY